LKTIGYGAFYACSTLQSLDIPDGLENIGINAFGECVSLKSVTIPSKTKTVSSFAFAFCKNLESVYIQEGVEFIHEGAFMGTQIKEVILPSTVKIDTISSIGCFDSAVKIKR
jgi:hypothetical protein